MYKLMEIIKDETLTIARTTSSKKMENLAWKTIHSRGMGRCYNLYVELNTETAISQTPLLQWVGLN